MSQKSNPTLIGSFVLGALALFVAAVFVLAGTSPFARKQHYVMYFEGSVFGLKVGSPVVFRGVQVGSVKRIDIRYAPGKQQFIIPVIVESAEKRVTDIKGNVAADNPPDPTELVKRGLRARLALESILTGQLFIELDFFPDKPAVFRAPDKNPDEIPTILSPAQEIAEKLKHIDFENLINDVAAIASSTREFVNGPELARMVKSLDASLVALQAASEGLNRRIDPLADDLAQTAKATTAAVKSAQATMHQVGAAADRLAAAGDSTAAPLQEIKAAAEELRRTASSLNELVGEGLPTLHQAGRTIRDLSQAARSLQDLADSLEQQPNALLFGRRKPSN